MRQTNFHMLIYYLFFAFCELPIYILCTFFKSVLCPFLYTALHIDHLTHSFVFYLRCDLLISYNMYSVKPVDIFNIQKGFSFDAVRLNPLVYQLDFVSCKAAVLKYQFLIPCLGSLSMRLHSRCWNQAAQANSFCLTFFLNQDSVEYCIIGVTILSQLTNEINQVSATAFLIEVSAIFLLSIGVFCLCVGWSFLAVVCFCGKWLMPFWNKIVPWGFPLWVQSGSPSISRIFFLSSQLSSVVLMFNVREERSDPKSEIRKPASLVCSFCYIS